MLHSLPDFVFLGYNLAILLEHQRILEYLLIGCMNISLLKVLRLISKKHGPLQNLLTMTNSIESQRTALKNILNKFKSELDFYQSQKKPNQEEILKWFINLEWIIITLYKKLN